MLCSCACIIFPTQGNEKFYNLSGLRDIFSLRKYFGISALIENSESENGGGNKNAPLGNLLLFESKFIAPFVTEFERRLLVGN